MFEKYVESFVRFLKKNAAENGSLLVSVDFDGWFGLST